MQTTRLVFDFKLKPAARRWLDEAFTKLNAGSVTLPITTLNPLRGLKMSGLGTRRRFVWLPAFVPAAQGAKWGFSCKTVRAVISRKRGRWMAKVEQVSAQPKEPRPRENWQVRAEEIHMRYLQSD